MAATTYSAYRTAVTKHIIPACGRIPLQQLRPVHVEQVLRGLADRGMSRKTQLNVLGVLSKAMRDALRWELIVRNPCEGVEKPTAEKPPITTWTLAEVRQFLAALEGHEHAAAFLLLVTTGIRRGELAGLTWPCVDLEAGRIRVARVLTYSGGKRVWKEPKTRAGERTVALDAGTVAALRAWKVEQAQQRLAAGPVWSTVSVDDFRQGVEGVVFTHPDGSAIAPNRWGTWLRKICADAGRRSISPHDIRHTAATHGLAMAASMQDMKTLSARLGHASIAFTVDRYADALAEQDQRLADGLGQLYGSTASLEEHRQQRDGGAHEGTAGG